MFLVETLDIIERRTINFPKMFPLFLVPFFICIFKQKMHTNFPSGITKQVRWNRNITFLDDMEMLIFERITDSFLTIIFRVTWCSGIPEIFINFMQNKVLLEKYVIKNKYCSGKKKLFQQFYRKIKNPLKSKANFQNIPVF